MALALTAAVLLPLAAVQPGRMANAAPVGLLADNWDPGDVDVRGTKTLTAAQWRLEDVRAEIDAANGIICKAIEDRDAVSAASVYSLDANTFGVGGDERHGRHEIADLYRDIFRDGYRDLEITTVGIRRVQDDLVLEEGRFTYHHKDGRKKLYGRFMTVWKFENGRWLVYRDMANI